MEKWAVNAWELSCTCRVGMKKGLRKHKLGIQMIQREVICPPAANGPPWSEKENMVDQKSIQGTYGRVSH